MIDGIFVSLSGPISGKTSGKVRETARKKWVEVWQLDEGPSVTFGLVTSTHPSFPPITMPRAPASERKAPENKRDPRLRPLRAEPVDHWAWLPEVVVRTVVKAPIEHNVHGRESKPSFYEMVKAALLSHKVHHLRGVPMNAIYKHVAANWPVDLDTYRRLTRVAIKRAIEQGKIEQADGPSVAYRLTAAERPEASSNGSSKSARSKARGSRASSSKRGTTNANGKSKRKVQEESDEESSEEEVVAPRKKATKKSANGRKTGDFDTQQPGEGKWVRSIPLLYLITHVFPHFFALKVDAEDRILDSKVFKARQSVSNGEISTFE